MATYNGERFLEQQLCSLNEQTILPNELVVCDDGSSDRTPEILAQFRGRALFPVQLVINERRLGWRENFLKAASLCTSDYIAFCDQDDIWLPGKISVVSPYLDEDRCRLLQHGFRLIDREGKFVSGELKYDEIKYAGPAHDVRWRVNYGMTQIFHRSLLQFWHLWEFSEDHFIAGGKMAHDQWVAFLGSLFDKTITIDDVLIYYRQHDTNIIGFRLPGRQLGGINRWKNLSINLSRIYGEGDEFRKKREDIIRGLQRRETAAAAREKIIELMIPQVPVERAGSLRAHLGYYRDFRRYQSQRLLTYMSGTRTERLRAAVRNYVRAYTRPMVDRGLGTRWSNVIYEVAS